LGLGWCLSLAAGDISRLRQLEDTHRIFELRRVLEQPGWSDIETLFYRAVLNARFGNETVAINELQKVLAAPSDSKTKRNAYEELGSTLVRTGQYRAAEQAWDEALRLTPDNDQDRSGNENTRALCGSLNDIQPQTIDFGENAPIQATRNRLGSWDVPVELNGRQSKWIFDTGASFSTLADSEASKMGLRIRGSSTYVKGSTGKKNALRVAVADDLRFGTAHLRNVVFLVLADAALYISPLQHQITGILGVPAIRALGRVQMSANGSVQIGPTEPAAQGDPDLFFDGLTPIVEARHRGHLTQMFLDTGANTTFVYPSFRDAMEKGEINRLTRKRTRTAGAGGMVTRTTEIIGTLRLGFPGRDVDFQKVNLLPSQPEGNARYWDGVLGMDGLGGGFTLDFRTMQLIFN
jgi:hypothetical protein